MLKAPPRKNPIIPEKIIVNMMLKVATKNTVRHPQMIMHE
jgi:hypothetical protein